MIAIIDFGAGNLYSAYHAFRHYYAKTEIVRNPEKIKSNVKGLVLPGDGSFPFAFDRLTKKKFTHFIKENRHIPLLGICVGFQLLFSSSAEDGGSEGLGIIPGEVKRFVSKKEKIPHMGWNNCQINRQSKLLTNIPNSTYFYFVHSYYPTLLEPSQSIMTCHYIKDFAAAVEQDNTYGCQFHPEKSHLMGWKMIENFVRICQAPQKNIN